MRILLIEDSSDDAELLTLALLEDGLIADIQQAQTLPDLRQALAGPAPELVICDGRLPGFDAAEALPWIRQAWPGVPIILCLGHIDDSPATQALLAAADGHIDKRRLQDLPGLIRKLLD